MLFHPSAPSEPSLKTICWVNGVLVIGKGKQQINKRAQDEYACQRNPINEGTVFHISCCNFKPLQHPLTMSNQSLNLFVPKDEQHQLQTTSLTNIEKNVNCCETSKKISQLRDEGIEIDDEGPAPENVSKTPATKSGQWEKPRTCPRHGDINITDVRGA
ncbi:LOW QUALITY PROTEIN: hypothetical protein ACHAW6_002549 [Cyclotella cf. meneghiniana]